MNPGVSEVYISVDIEASGPIPGEHSMLSFGACVVGDPTTSFYAELKPITDCFEPEALKVSGFDMAELKRTGRDAADAMKEFAEWVFGISNGRKPVFVGFNGCYDWQFVNWYFLSFCKKNPFGFGGIDIKSYYMGLCGLRWDQTSSSQLPDEFKPDVPQTHNALEDAKAQASIFLKMLKKKRSLS